MARVYEQRLGLPHEGLAPIMLCAMLCARIVDSTMPSLAARHWFSQTPRATYLPAGSQLNRAILARVGWL